MTINRYFYQSTYGLPIILGFGLFCRLYSYSYNRSLWSDETNVIFGIANTPWSSLQLPLAASPGGAYLFNVLEKIMLSVFGFNDYALRFFPFLCSCVALFIFYKIATRFLPRFVGFLSLLLFACCDNIIYYALEIRPHSLDLLVTCLGLYLYFHLHQTTLMVKHITQLLFFGLISIFCSFIAPIILFSLGTSLFIQYFLKQHKSNCLYLIYVAMGWLIIFSSFYFFSYQHWLSNSESMTYFGNVFQYLHFPGFTVTAIKENSIQLFRFVAFFVGLRMQAIDIMPSDIIRSMTSLQSVFVLLKQHLFFWFYIFTLSLTNGFILLASLLSAAKLKQPYLLFLLLPLALILILATNHLYPFLGRHLLFTFPLLFILSSTWLNQLKSSYKKLTLILCIFLIFNPIYSSFNNIVAPRSLNKLKNGISIAQSINYDQCYVLGTYNWLPFYQTRYNISLDTLTHLRSIHDLGLLTDTYPTMLFILNTKKLQNYLTHITSLTSRYQTLGYSVNYINLNNHETVMFLLQKTSP